MIRKTGALVPGQSGKLKGKLMFGASQLWGKVGHAFLRAISHRQYEKPCSGNPQNTEAQMKDQLTPALEFLIDQWINLIAKGPPREIGDTTPRLCDVVIFTDGFTPDQRKA